MHPILTTLELGPWAVRLLAILAAAGLTWLVHHEGTKKRGPSGARTTRLETLAFGAVALIAAIVLPLVIGLPAETAIELRTWGVMTAAAMFTGLWVQQRFGRRAGVEPERIFDLWLFGGLCGLVLGRLIHVAGAWEQYASQPARALAFWDGGLVFLGVVLGYGAFALHYVRKHRLPRRTFDALVIALPIGHVLGRLGCFAAGCCFGEATHSSFGVQFPLGSIAHHALASSHVISPSAAATMPLHPTQLYEAGAELLIFGLLWWRSARPHAAGTITCLYFTLYPAVRIVLELVRADPERTYVLPWLSESQAISVVLLLAAAAGWWILERQPFDARSSDGSSSSSSIVM